MSIKVASAQPEGGGVNGGNAARGDRKQGSLVCGQRRSTDGLALCLGVRDKPGQRIRSRCQADLSVVDALRNLCGIDGADQSIQTVDGVEGGPTARKGLRPVELFLHTARAWGGKVQTPGERHAERQGVDEGPALSGVDSEHIRAPG